MPLLKCIIVHFSDWWKVKIEEIQVNSTHIFMKQNGKDDLFEYQCFAFTANIWINQITTCHLNQAAIKIAWNLMVMLFSDFHAKTAKSSDFLRKS